MRELPILFNTEMVRAILDGRKSQTRRILKPQPDHFHKFIDEPLKPQIGDVEIKPKYQPGDRLWVRETWNFCIDPFNDMKVPLYKADCELTDDPWKSPIFMPKKYARIWLEVTGVRVERIRDIKPSGITKEGILPNPWGIEEFKCLWDRIYKSKPEYQWEANPWVWVYEFKKRSQNENF